MSLALLTANRVGRARTEWIGDREYRVSPMVLIVPGVLAGSQGALLYPPDEIAKNPDWWNGRPLTLRHPMVNGQAASARTPGAATVLGHVAKPTIGRHGRLLAEGWFDVQLTRQHAPAVLRAVERGDPVELSTGLYTDNEPTEGYDLGSGKRYAAVARNYRPDHVAILPNDKGACSLKDGCGVGVVSNTCECEGCAMSRTKNAKRSKNPRNQTPSRMEVNTPGFTEGDNKELTELLNATYEKWEANRAKAKNAGTVPAARDGAGQPEDVENEDEDDDAAEERELADAEAEMETEGRDLERMMENFQLRQINLRNRRAARNARKARNERDAKGHGVDDDDDLELAGMFGRLRRDGEIKNRRQPAANVNYYGFDPAWGGYVPSPDYTEPLDLEAARERYDFAPVANTEIPTRGYEEVSPRIVANRRREEEWLEAKLREWWPPGLPDAPNARSEPAHFYGR